ncbi:MAG: WD40/YVTN/BNR-like repeat-containing protein, partial [Chitinophagaceae bacterium]
MNKFLMPLAIFSMLATGTWFLKGIESDRYEMFKESEEMEGEENEQEAGVKRAYYEWFISRDPKTGRIPENIRLLEMEQARMIGGRNSGIMGDMALNTYYAVGPTQNGGRTRALAFDLRYNGTSNKVVLAGGINGGIFRSTDGGITWQFVHPSNEVRSVSCFAQDASSPNTWYAGTGEALGASAGQPNAFVFGYGVFKSTDNGLTWTKLSSTVSAASDGQFKFDSNFDIITNIAVHPTTGDVYVACHQVIFRSKDGGTTWSAVLKGQNSVYNNEGLTDILINKSGSQIYAAFSGRNSDRSIVGVWKSTSGDTGQWTRIAGGLLNQPDSVAGWRAYDLSKNSSGSFSAGWGRIVLGLTAAD